MRLARKLTLALMLGILVVMAGGAALQVRRERTLFQDDSAHDQRRLGRALRTAIEVVLGRDGEAAARQLVSETSALEDEVRLRWVSLDPEPPADEAPVLAVKGLAAARAGQEVTVEATGPDRDARRYTYVPLGDRTPARFALEVSESLSPERRFILATELHTVLSSLVILVLWGFVTVGVGVWLVGRPMQRLAEKARRVGTGDLSGPLALRQRDEIGELAQELNAMCEQLGEAQAHLTTATEARIAALEQLRHADRLKTVGQLASGVAHELGTPLNVVSGRAKMVAQAPGAATTGENARIIVEQAERMAGIIRQLLDFSRRRGVSRGPGDLRLVAAGTIDLLRSLATKRGVTISLDDAGGPLDVLVDVSQVQQALANLVVNAIQAMPKGGHLTVRLARNEAQPPVDHGGPVGAYCCVAVEDDGQGIPLDHLPHLFEPFFTTKDVGEGTGLGLAVSYGIIREHGGWIDVESRPGSGSRFAIWLPPAEAA